MHFILDGYNIIFKLSSLFNSPNIKNSRVKLIHYIRIKSPQGSHRNPVTIVFDSSQLITDYPIPSGIEVKFANKISADDYIIKLIEKSPTPKMITLVTDDRELQLRAKTLDASYMGVEDFFAPKMTHKPKGSSKPSLSATDMREINSELLAKERPQTTKKRFL
jgi:predicted RNA-binding protein with PIN domain